MIPKITDQFLIDENASVEMRRWFGEQTENRPLFVVAALVGDNKLDLANWLVVVLMDYKQYVDFAIFAAEEATDILSKQGMGERHSTFVIGQARKCLEGSDEKNKFAVILHPAANFGAYSAGLAAKYSSPHAARDASQYVSDICGCFISANAKNKMQLRMIRYGMELLAEIEPLAKGE